LLEGIVNRLRLGNTRECFERAGQHNGFGVNLVRRRFPLAEIDGIAAFEIETRADRGKPQTKEQRRAGE
jgi:hypothetical protein